MQFSHEYFPDHIKTWEKIFSQLKGKKLLRYLEVGVFEGQSAFWMKENILTHKTCELVLVDLFLPHYEKTFLSNLNQIDNHNITILKGESPQILKNLKSNDFDIIYIDGGHIAKDIFLDLANAWNLLKVNGILVIDDYPLLKDEAPIHMRPGLIIDCFITAFSEEIEVIHKDWQVAIKKKKIHLKGINPYSWNKYQKVGHYLYDWHLHVLLDDEGNKAEVNLTPKEKLVLRDLLINVQIGDDSFKISTSLKKNAVILNLTEKLGLNK